MSLARPTSTVSRGSGVAPDSGPTSAWQEIANSDVTLSQGNYTASHAAGQNGFTHRITIDTGADSAFFETAKCAYLYFDTGITMATLSNNLATVISVLLEFDIPPDSVLGADADAEFHFGPVINNNTTISSSGMGMFGGMIMNNNNQNDFFAMITSGIGKAGNNSSLSAAFLERGTGDNAYDHSNGDILKTIQMTATGFAAKEAGDKFGITGGDLMIGHTKGASGAVVTNKEEMVLRTDRIAGLGNLYIGVMFGQNTDVNGSGTAGNSKTLDFSIKYMIEQIVAS
jgi:hypothetical protein